MILRPVDSNGDILPVLSSSALVQGAPAVALLVRDRLELLSGDWWEDPALGNAVVELLKESCFTDTDRMALSSYLSSYIRETPGVLDVRDVSFSGEGKEFSFSCTVDTEDGEAGIDYMI